MLGSTYEGQVCSVARALEIVGERWTLLIVRDASQGMHRFEEFHKSLGLARNVLSDRLGKLVEHGILQRVEYSERPARSEYHLTERGRELRGVVLSLMQWGDKYLQNGQAPLSFVDADTGRVLGVRVTADIDEPATRSDDIEIRFNPPSRHRSLLSSLLPR